jgi:hypothetical protein
MLDSYNYRSTTRGNSQVILYNVLAGRYQASHLRAMEDPGISGTTALMVGVTTTVAANVHQADAIENTDWVEGSQYVRFDRSVATGQTVEVSV